jgi:hypothetical protein
MEWSDRKSLDHLRCLAASKPAKAVHKKHFPTGYGITATRRFLTMTTGGGASLREACHDGVSPDNTGFVSLAAKQLQVITFGSLIRVSGPSYLAKDNSPARLARLQKLLTVTGRRFSGMLKLHQVVDWSGSLGNIATNGNSASSSHIAGQNAS